MGDVPPEAAVHKTTVINQAVGPDGVHIGIFGYRDAKGAYFEKEIDRTGYSQLNMMGLIACQAAYENGGGWLEECRAYLRGNLEYLRAFLQERLPQVKLVEPEGTYFAWLDCSGLDLCRRELNDLIVNRARLCLDAGHLFGQNAGQFQRIVLACPRVVLAQALEQLEQAVNG